ncbi:hypothetical protein OAE48_01560 [Flavobacteriales bacterium]|nr:hypothetical protein [Flavobacteriales bacterium]
MIFPQLAEAFISLLCHCHNIEPRVIVHGEIGQNFEDLMDSYDYHILMRDENHTDTAFRPTYRAVEMEKQMREDQLSIYHALAILKELKSEYWLDNYYPTLHNLTKVVFERAYVDEYHPIASQEEIDAVITEYLEHCDELRNSFYDTLISILKSGSDSTETDEINEYSKGLKDILSEKGLKNFDTLLNSLMNADPPLLSNDRRWIGKPKNAICLWLDTLHQRGYIDGRHSNETLSRVVCNEFEGLRISPSSFDKVPYLRAEQIYKNQFKRLIP